ncbi:hypothetical protein A2609_01505 [Candidatus Kaiserbacteria bacterium RIFOXYD1_FULL_47_14]|uniref:Uncharacterized protein n=1 Tax=Candidatus Kaiserbacteria bacterium RIFOXYD1_FULL_47_14 TaxID=1798533 RepID=A0A1F6G5F5_9BACT|nr:MAG: hypothetical protein A2609_01505 [Candidatus Kaiserbacteria bacterium RIFOXYD1_FULL_47_14]
MASVRNRKTRARETLDYALGKAKYVSFGQLSVSESNELLRTTLQDVDLRELRGFKLLKDLLVFRPGSTVYGGETSHTLDLKTLELSDTVSFLTRGFEETLPVDMATHVLRLYRWIWNWQMTFKRNESGEETDDKKVASSWGRSAHHHKGSGEVLAVRRPHNHTRADENLIVINFWYEKIPFEERHIITRIEVDDLPLQNFRKHFGVLYAQAAVELIGELRSAYSSTASELRSQLNYIERRTAELERLSGAITYR